MSRKTNALDALSTSITEMVNMAACDVGGLSLDEADEWRDRLSGAVEDGLEGVQV